MTTEHIHLTITTEEKAFLDKKNFSPTQLLKEKIHEIQDLTAPTQHLFDEMQRRIRRLADTVDKQRVFIERKGLIDEFLKEGEVFNGSSS